MFKSFRDQSRSNFGNSDETPSLDQINAGSFMRIADSAEKMALSHTELIRSRDFYEKECERLRDISATLERSNAALRGHLKRMKRENRS